MSNKTTKKTESKMSDENIGKVLASIFPGFDTSSRNSRDPISAVRRIVAATRNANQVSSDAIGLATKRTANLRECELQLALAHQRIQSLRSTNRMLLEFVKRTVEEQ